MPRHGYINVAGRVLHGVPARASTLVARPVAATQAGERVARAAATFTHVPSQFSQMISALGALSVRGARPKFLCSTCVDTTTGIPGVGLSGSFERTAPAEPDTRSCSYAEVCSRRTDLTAATRAGRPSSCTPRGTSGSLGGSLGQRGWEGDRLLFPGADRCIANPSSPVQSKEGAAGAILRIHQSGAMEPGEERGREEGLDRLGRRGGGMGSPR